MIVKTRSVDAQRSPSNSVLNSFLNVPEASAIELHLSRKFPAKFQRTQDSFGSPVDLSFYIGHSDSIRQQIEMLIDSQFEEKLAGYQAESLFAPTPVSFSIANYEGYSASARDPVKCLLIEEYSPRMNAKKVVA